MSEIHVPETVLIACWIWSIVRITRATARAYNEMMVIDVATHSYFDLKNILPLMRIRHLKHTGMVY